MGFRKSFTAQLQVWRCVISVSSKEAGTHALLQEHHKALCGPSTASNKARASKQPENNGQASALSLYPLTPPWGVS